jgi:hypothetical protein
MASISTQKNVRERPTGIAAKGYALDTLAKINSKKIFISKSDYKKRRSFGPPP